MSRERELCGQGLAVWSVLRDAAGQVRALGPAPVGLDWTAIHLQGAALGADPAFLAECLALVEPLILKHLSEMLRHG